MNIMLFLFQAVFLLKVQGAITPPMAEYITDGIERAERENASLVLLEMDTPGGLDESMRQIVQKELESSVPVCVYVYPKGARAASAGAFILLAANKTAMSPGTSVGAAHPVNVQGKMDSIMAKKMENYAASYIKSIAKTRGRKADIAEKMVTESLSFDAEEALKLKIADYIAPDEDSLLRLLDGDSVKINGNTVVLRVKNEQRKEVKMTLRQKLLVILTSPNVAYILMMIGMYGLLFELSHPGAIFPGVIGAVSLVLAFYSFQTLPVNYAGILLIVLGIFFFILDIKIPSHGLLSLSGLLSIAGGSFLMFRGNAPFFKVSVWSILLVLGFTLVFFLWIVAKAAEAIYKKPVSGKEGLVGETGIAKTDITDREGMALVHGELWQARSEKLIKKGDSVKVVKVKGFIIYVEKVEE